MCKSQTSTENQIKNVLYDIEEPTGINNKDRIKEISEVYPFEFEIAEVIARAKKGAEA